MPIPFLALVVPLHLPLSTGEDWPHLRGPRLDGTASSDGALRAAGESGGELALRAVWKKPLGPSYSAVAVADGLAVTVFSDGTSDNAIAFDARTGAERWRHVLEPTYVGHDGSEDGLISSPALGGGRAFLVTPRGKAVALALADGKEAWTRDLVADLGAVLPEYGFGSSPLLERGRLIVQAGGPDGRLLCALDPATGATVWTAGEGQSDYGSPIAMDLAGRRQVVVLAGARILGVAPEDGAVLWTYELPGERDRAGSGVATAIDGERFFAGVSGAITVFRVSRAGDAYAVEEVVRMRELGRSYAAPVHAKGRLWGFKNEFLTCCDATTGERLWKSRPPGGAGLILVDDRLVVFGAQGTVAVVDTDDGDYRELASAPIVEASSLVWPSFADGRVYLRNSAEIACVELVPAGGAAVAAASDAPAGADPVAHAGGGAFAAFLRGLSGAADAGARVDAFLAEHAELPVLEGGMVHFLWRGEAQDVAIAGSMLEDGHPEPLARVPGTDLWVRSYPIEDGARLEYRFQVDYGDWIPDPANPRRVPGTETETVSEVVTPGYAERAHFLPRADGPRGRLEELEFASASLGNTRKLTVYLPAGYDEGDARYPLLLVQEGPDWIEKGGLVNALDNLCGAGVRPLVAVFVEQSRRWWYEGGGTGTEEYVDALATELVPFLAERFRIASDPSERALLGKESFGLTVVLAALGHPDVFGKAAVLSHASADRAHHTVDALLAAERREGASFFVGWSRYDARSADRGYDFRAESAALAEALRARGYPVAGGEALDAYGWGGWRARTAELLEALFPQR